MNKQINHDSVIADIRAIESMLEKYQIDPENIYGDEINIQFPKYIPIDDLNLLVNRTEELAEVFCMFMIDIWGEFERRDSIRGIRPDTTS